MMADNMSGELVKIVEYSNQYQRAFKALNTEWISKFFELEEADYQALDHPEENILRGGGKIFVALYQGEAVGVCGLKKTEHRDFDYEMVKMAVSPKAQGKKIGWLLGQATVEAAKKLGGRNIYLEGNTKLEASIALYHKLGFKEIKSFTPSYKRVDIIMLLTF
ncbi:GNAT family N-acetyltransferase [Sphingobacterium wenxiniae]|nr:GNAT family N-acetyltransferase [Sphingobacterium wenxiniae]